jgi:hypothetical protein
MPPQLPPGPTTDIPAYIISSFFDDVVDGGGADI